jgi:hypothetical protein
MLGILSPIMKKVVEDEASYPSPSAKTKINKAIGRYKLLSAGEKWKEYMDDIKFALADLLMARGEEKDYKEALGYYNFIISKTRNNMLKGRSMIGKAELVIAGVAKMDIDDAIKLCREGGRLLKSNLTDFFAAKGLAVEAELLAKKSGKPNIREASKLFGRLIGKRNANPYFRARAMAGKAELILYFGVDPISNGIKLCEEALKLFSERQMDYFAVKARVIEAEMLIRRGSSSDIAKAENLCKKVILAGSAHKDLVARAKIVLAEVSKKERAERLFEEVMDTEGIDPYLIEKAKLTEKAYKSRLN